MLLLMFIGGAAQSTAGGVKVNAFAAAVLSLFAVIRMLRYWPWFSSVLRL